MREPGTATRWRSPTRWNIWGPTCGLAAAAMVRQRRDQPESVVGVVSDRLLFGEQHPYGRPAEGYARTLEHLTLADARGFHATHWRPNHAFLVVAGAFDPAQLRDRRDQPHRHVTALGPMTVAVDRDAGADEIEPRLREQQRRGTVRRVADVDRRARRDHGALDLREPGELEARHRVRICRIVGVGVREVGHQADDCDPVAARFDRERNMPGRR